MSERRRRQLAAIAAKHRLVVVEDDTYGFLSPEREPLATILPDQTVFITSLSKSLFPGLRVGCVVPPAALLEPITSALWATMVNSSPIDADIMSSWIEDGTAARIAEWKQREVAARFHRQANEPRATPDTGGIGTIAANARYKRYAALETDPRRGRPLSGCRLHYPYGRRCALERRALERRALQRNIAPELIQRDGVAHLRPD